MEGAFFRKGMAPTTTTPRLKYIQLLDLRNISSSFGEKMHLKQKAYSASQPTVLFTITKRTRLQPADYEALNYLSNQQMMWTVSLV